MNLLIDIGNTEITIYIEKKDETFEKYKFNSYPNENITNEFDELFKEKNFEKIIVASVVPIMFEEIEKYFASKTNNFINLNYSKFVEFIDFGDLDYKNMGADRVVVSFAALDEYGSNIMVFDLGTAVTVDVFKNKQLINGYIFPGLKLIRKSLVDGTSLLETFHFAKVNESNNCLDTNSQLNDGIIYGLIGVINQYIKINSKHFEDDYKIIVTGGVLFQLMEYIGSDNVKTLFDEKIIFDKDLMYKGLSKIAQRSENKE